MENASDRKARLALVIILASLLISAATGVIQLQLKLNHANEQIKNLETSYELLDLEHNCSTKSSATSTGLVINLAIAEYLAPEIGRLMRDGSFGAEDPGHGYLWYTSGWGGDPEGIAGGCLRYSNFGAEVSGKKLREWAKLPADNPISREAWNMREAQ